MTRLSVWSVVALLGACGSTAPAERAQKERASGVEERPATPTKGENEVDCEPLANADTRRVRLVGQGSHALARSDLSLDLESGKLTGESFVLEGDTPRIIKVDETVAAEEVQVFRERLQASCAARKPVADVMRAAPGGYSALELRDADGNAWWVSMGGAPPNAKGILAELDRESWTALIELWPEPAVRRRAK